MCSAVRLPSSGLCGLRPSSCCRQRDLAGWWGNPGKQLWEAGRLRDGRGGGVLCSSSIWKRQFFLGLQWDLGMEASRLNPHL